MLSLKILYMQTMNYLQDMSLASGDIETLASESIKRISKFTLLFDFLELISFYLHNGTIKAKFMNQGLILIIT